jgi:hypothetical protein
MERIVKLKSMNRDINNLRDCGLRDDMAPALPIERSVVSREVNRHATAIGLANGASRRRPKLYPYPCGRRCKGWESYIYPSWMEQ